LALTINPQGSTSHRIGQTQSAIQRNLERLSSGRRINKASDDSAGLSLSQKLQAFEAAMNQGSRNLSDGISLVRVAEGGLNETSSNLSRMRELSVQAQNGTLGDAERNVLQQEFNDLAKEVTRSAETTQFNGKQLLNGDASSGNGGEITLEDGSQSGEDVSISIESQSAAALGVEGLDVSDGATLDALDNALDQVTSARSSLGSTENRLESQIRSLEIQSQNAAEANSRIVDTDYANETAQSTRNSILQQFQVALQGQANASAGAVLQLLTG
jgi:flagellin